MISTTVGAFGIELACDLFHDPAGPLLLQFPFLFPNLKN
jgi:hypothetical protein